MRPGVLPCMGEDNEYVYHQASGMKDEEILSAYLARVFLNRITKELLEKWHNERVYTRELGEMIEGWKGARSGPEPKWLPDATPHSTFEVVSNRDSDQRIDERGSPWAWTIKIPLGWIDTYAEEQMGRIIGVPSLSGAIAVSGIERSLLTPTGFAPPMGYAMGGSTQWFKRICAGDSFRVRSGEATTLLRIRPEMDGKGPYLFLVSTRFEIYQSERQVVVYQYRQADETK